MQEGELWNIYRMPENLESQSIELVIKTKASSFSGLASRIVPAGEGRKSQTCNIFFFTCAPGEQKKDFRMTDGVFEVNQMYSGSMWF